MLKIQVNPNVELSLMRSSFSKLVCIIASLAIQQGRFRSITKNNKGKMLKIGMSKSDLREEIMNIFQQHNVAN